MLRIKHVQALQNGEVTIAELRGITNEEMEAGISAGRKLMDSGEYQAAAEVLAGLALYDPFRPGVWRALEDLFRRRRLPEQANLFSDLARIMAV
jgi:hypothetical protein